MNMDDTEGEDHELYAESFVDLNWVKCWGLGKENALDYFACSQFYDLKCNNEKLRMQNRPLSDLEKMIGIEYVLERNEEFEPFLFVVVKQKRSSESQALKVAKYYILDKVIYQSPNLHTLFESRLQKFCNHVQKAFNKISKAAHYNPSEGYTWHLATDDENEYTKAWRESMEVAAFEQRRRRREEEKDRKGDEHIDGILNQLVETYIPQYVKKDIGGGNGQVASQDSQQASSSSSSSAVKSEPPTKRNKLS